MKRKLNPTTPITAENVQHFGETIAICALKTHVRRCGHSEIIKLYNDLIVDIRRQNHVQHVMSDAYDFAQTAICFLIEHYGKSLDTYLYTAKNGRKITVEVACLRAVDRLSNRKSRDLVRHLDISAVESIPTTPVELDHEQESPESIQATQAKITSLNLTQKQQDVLSYRMEGLSYAKIGMAMSIGEGTSFQILKKVRQVYLQKFAVQA